METWEDQEAGSSDIILQMYKNRELDELLNGVISQNEQMNLPPPLDLCVGVDHTGKPYTTTPQGGECSVTMVKFCYDGGGYSPDNC